MGSSIVLEGMMIGLLTLSAYIIGHFASPGTYLGQTMAFVTLSSAQLFHAFNVKSDHSILNKKLFSNKYLLGAFVLGMGLQMSICYIKPLAKLFKVIPLELEYLGICLALAFAPIVIVEVAKLIKKLIRK
jgi:Ca2+-transporting ATPase